MKRTLIMSLAIISICSFVACTNENNKSEGNVEQVVENNSVMVDEGITEEEKEEEENREENNIAPVIEEGITDKENNYNKHYEMVKNIVENKKMTIIKSDNREIQAENGLGESIVYKLKEDNEIIISYSVKLTSILNDDKYIIDVNEAITNYFNEEKESYIEDIDRVKVDINQDYDFVIIKITI